MDVKNVIIGFIGHEFDVQSNKKRNFVNEISSQM